MRAGSPPTQRPSARLDGDLPDPYRRRPEARLTEAKSESLPPFPFRHAFIPAVHEVAPRLFDVHEVELAAPYAVVTALAANVLLGLGECGYALRAGRVFVRLPGIDAGEIDPVVPDERGLAVHAWAERKHPSGRVEVADLSTRHFNSWAARAGLRFEPRIPRAVWGWEDELPRAFRYEPDEQATAGLEAAFAARHGTVAEAAAREIVGRLNGGGA